MIKRLKIYTPFINAGIQETASYRVDLIIGLFGDVLACFVSYFIWKAVFLSSGGEMLHGFTMPQMIVYIFLIFLTSVLIHSGVTYDIGEEIRDGSIAMRMLKPVSYNATFLFQEIGNKLVTTVLLIVPLVFGVEAVRTHVMGRVEFDIARFFLYLLSCIFAYLVNFFFNICFGFIAFVVKYLWGANMMKS